MGLMDQERVHVAPLGVENTRISEPAIEYNADHIVLLRYLPPNSELDEIHTELEENLDEAGVTYEYRIANLENLFDALAEFGEVIEEFESDTVFVNLSSGNKIAAVAGMIACMSTGGANPYYVKAQQFDSFDPQPSGARPARGIESVSQIPPYPMDRPTDEQLKVMQYIDSANVEMRNWDKPFRKKKDLIEFGEEENLPFIERFEGDTQKGKFRRLDADIIEPLRDEWDFVQVTEDGRRKRVSLTDKGKNTLKGFQYLLE